jgi:hypothetical protein
MAASAQDRERAAHERGRAPVDVAHAVGFAPAREVCRLWLTRRGFAAPATFTASPGEAAWAGLRTAAQPDNTQET